MTFGCSVERLLAIMIITSQWQILSSSFVVLSANQKLSRLGGHVPQHELPNAAMDQKLTSGQLSGLGSGMQSLNRILRVQTIASAAPTTVNYRMWK
jgi:hypothetical protein